MDMSAARWLLEFDLRGHSEQATLQHGQRLAECRAEGLILLQHHVAVERVEHVERAVDAILADSEDLTKAQIELIPAIEVAAARRNQVDRDRLRAAAGATGRAAAETTAAFPAARGSGLCSIQAARTCHSGLSLDVQCLPPLWK